MAGRRSAEHIQESVQPWKEPRRSLSMTGLDDLPPRGCAAGRQHAAWDAFPPQDLPLVSGTRPRAFF